MDASGTKLITSNNPDGNNVGFPSSKPGIDHFMAMLEQTHQRLADDELATLRAALDKR